MNNLTQPYVVGVQAAVSFALCDPRPVLDARVRFRRDPVPGLDRVTSLYVPTGRWPVRGWVLLPRYEYNQLNTYATNLQLQLGDPAQPTNTGTFQNLAIVQAQNVTRGLLGSANDLYLVELTDARGILHNRWFQHPMSALYNVRAPGYPNTFMPASMNFIGPGYTTWTWETMLQDMWEAMPLLGPWPGLPAGYTVAGTPEGYLFTGVGAWHALCDVLDHIGLTVACDLTQVDSYTIVNSGEADPVFTALQALLATNLEDDQEWIDTGAGRVPATIVLLFRRRNEVYGTEETVTYGQYVGAVEAKPFQWEMDYFYAVTVNAPAQFANAVGTHYLWDDFTVRFDMDNLPLADDVAIAATIAAERGSQYFANIYRQTLGYMSQTYTGALPFTTGSLVDGVCWEQGCGWNAWRTRIVGGILPPFPGVWE